MKKSILLVTAALSMATRSPDILKLPKLVEDFRTKDRRKAQWKNEAFNGKKCSGGKRKGKK